MFVYTIPSFFDMQQTASKRLLICCHKVVYETYETISEKNKQVVIQRTKSNLSDLILNSCTYYGIIGLFFSFFQNMILIKLSKFHKKFYQDKNFWRKIFAQEYDQPRLLDKNFNIEIN